MWIISQIERKNMTGKLQNDIPHKFFLTRYSIAFHVVYQYFLSSLKGFNIRIVMQKDECEYHENWLPLSGLVLSQKSKNLLSALTIAAHAKCFNEEMECV